MKNVPENAAVPWQETADGKRFCQSLYWQVLNYATIGGLGGSDAYPLSFAFEEADRAFCEYKELMAHISSQSPEAIMLQGGLELFLSGTVLFCRTKAASKEALKLEDLGAQSIAELWRRCYRLYKKSYDRLKRLKSATAREACVKTVTMLSVCHAILGEKGPAIRYATLEVMMREDLHGDWHPRTKKAISNLEALTGVPHDAGSSPTRRFSAPDFISEEEGEEDGKEEEEAQDCSLEHVKAEALVWDVNPFQVSRTWSISAVLRMFDALGLIARFSIPMLTLVNFVERCQRSYRSNPFHNWHHAWSVTHCAYMILKHDDMATVLPPEDMLVIMVSCLVHDLDHPGVTSDFLIKSGSTLALTFPERNLLEQMHWSFAKQILSDVDTDILAYVDPAIKVCWVLGFRVWDTDFLAYVDPAIKVCWDLGFRVWDTDFLAYVDPAIKVRASRCSESLERVEG
jgi:hypothetical protein